MIAAQYSANTGSEMMLSAQTTSDVASAKFLTGIVNVSARLASQTHDLADETEVVDISIENMEHPITLTIPLNEQIGPGDKGTCMYFNETTNLWTVLN